MCGIAGFIDRVQRPQAEKELRSMLSRIERRGPDGEGQWIQERNNWTLALGHRRLSIIDIEGGHQPLGNQDNSYIVTFNGEIFNFLELKDELIQKRYKFKTRSDTEVIVHLYEEEGIKGFERLNGMFAFAIWDERKNELILARDRSGVKPLYYGKLASGGIVFGSELTCVLANSHSPREVSYLEAANFFFSDYIQAPGSLIENVFKLEPGEYVVWSESSFQKNRFWNLDIDQYLTNTHQTKSHWFKKDSKTENELLDLVQSALEKSVERQLISDVPIGSFLSGGIDSSLVTAIAHKKYKTQIQTFSIGFEDKAFDESPYSGLMAKELKTKHYTETINESILLNKIDDALSSLDEPMADPSIIPTFILSELASKHVKVVLGGDGGDELWAGYPTYFASTLAPYYSYTPEFLRSNISEVVRNLKVNPVYQSLEWKLKRFVLRYDDNPFRRHLRWMSNTDLPDLKLAFPKLQNDPYVLTRFQYSNKDSVDQLLGLDFQTFMAGSVLAKVDRASMANGLEVRPPFLDNELIDLSFSIPSHWKLRGKTTKYLIKKISERYIPHEIIYRKKRGFAIPLASWLMGPLAPRVKNILMDSPVWEKPGLNRDAFKKWYETHLNKKGDHSKSLWALIVFDHWMKRENL